jgi:hypothetical protein
LARRGKTVRRRSGRAGPTGVARAGLCWRRLTPGVGKCKGVGRHEARRFPFSRLSETG